MELEKSHLQYIVEHVFLPPKLPQQYDSETEQKDESLYRFIAEASQQFVAALQTSPHGPSSRDLQSWELLNDMLQQVASIHQEHHLAKEAIESALQRMKPGSILPLHIAAQNAGIIFRKIDSQHMTFEAFELSLPTETITGTVGKIIQRFPGNPRLPFIAEPSVLRTLANVLSYLSDNTMTDAVPTSKKGGSSHQEVRQTVSPRYITEALAGVIRACPPEDGFSMETPYIHKRINDHALWKSALKPWRRTPSLLLIKVALQSTMAEKGIDKSHGYKSFWAFLMSLILDEALKEDPQVFTLDLLHVMNVKLTRRMEKLGQPVDENNISPLQIAVSVIYHASEELQSRWKQVQHRSSSVIQWSQLEVVSRHGFNLTFPNTQDFLRGVINRRSFLKATKNNTEENYKQLASACGPRLAQTSNLPPSIQRQEVDVGLFDFETWVKVQLPHWSSSPVRSSADCLPLYSIAHEYRDIAIAEYKDDPERLSLMHLCILELWIALDKIVCKWCPLLTQYSPEIREDFLDPLLLPTFEQMTRLHKVQTYLQDRHRIANAHNYPSLLDKVNSPRSFANRFFETPTAASLLGLESRIERWSEQQKAAKLREMQKRNNEYDYLMDEAQSMDCNDSFFVNRRGNRTYGHAHWQCKRCKKEKEAKRCKVKPFEEPLPHQQSQSRPIIFELECPQPIAVWRDLTAGIIFTPDLDCKPEASVYPLEAYHPLSQFYKPPYQDSMRVVGLASSAKSIQMSHYGDPRPCPVEEDDVLLRHAGIFRLFECTTKCWMNTTPKTDLRASCTFPTDGPYSGLQQYLCLTTHTPNAVIASIHDCPAELPTAEYIAFCQLRSGVRLQWWNIMRAIRTQSLTFSETSVASLILQSIWQAESLGDAGICREAHHDLQDQGFGNDIGEELLSSVQYLGSNWKQYIYLTILIALAFRLLEVSRHSSVREKAKSVIFEARALAKRWITDLEQADGQRPGHAIVAIAMAYRSTFDGSCITPLSTEDTAWFIHCGILAGSDSKGLTKTLRRFACRDKRISLQSEDMLLDMCRSDHSILDRATRLSWKGYIHGNPWQPLPSSAGRWWITLTRKDSEHESHIVYLNILDGTLLIDGKPSRRLPSDYTSHPVYLALLKDHVFFDIWPSQFKGMTYQVSHHNSELHFGLMNGELLIRRQVERQGTMVEEYLPTSKLKDELPAALLAGHHYWYIEDKRMIEIRPDGQEWDSSSHHPWTIQLYYVGGAMHGQVQGKAVSGENILIDPHSALYRSLSHMLQPLEPDEQGLVVTKREQDADGTTFIHLPRHDLSFQLNPSGELEIQSLPGYVVSRNREGIDCLFGLENIICLRPGNIQEKNGLKILVPKGKFAPKLGLYGHPSLAIQIGNQKGYFVYDVDDLVGRLVGSRTIESDLYLVKLHAFTASPLPDPLTLRSGTHEALDHLQSASCSSTLSISAETREYLDDIATLTPLRAAYPPHLEDFKMETVDWNPRLPATSQQLPFRTVVEETLEYWRETLIFHRQDDMVKELETPKGMDHLSKRDALRSSIFWTSSLHTNNAQDVYYQGRDSLTTPQSQARESMAYQMSRLTKQSSAFFPVSMDLSSVVIAWMHVRGNDEWSWEDIHQWFRAPRTPHISEIWCTLLQLCRRTDWPPPFEVTMTIGLLGFSGISKDLLASLVSVICSPSLHSQQYSCPSFNMLDLEEGSTFDTELISQLFNDCARDLAASKENKMKQLRNETLDERMDRVANAYIKALEEQVDEAVNELEELWDEEDGYDGEFPDIITRLSKRRLLDFSSPTMQVMQTKVKRWWENRAFLNHIGAINTILQLYRVHPSNPPLYRPVYPKPSASAPYHNQTTLRDLLSQRDLPPIQTKNSQSHSQGTLSSNQTHEQDLETLLSRLKDRVNSPFETQYLQLLEKSAKAPDSMEMANWDDKYLINIFTSRREECWTIAHQKFVAIKSALSPVTPCSKLSESSGIWPAITPHVLLKYLSLREKVSILPLWIDRLVDYATSLHDARRYDRILRHAFAKRYDQLSPEKYYLRKWDAKAHPDWLLFEIDTNMSIRTTQADLALDMIHSETRGNAILQLNMGEGKSSVIVPIVAATLGSKEGVLPRVIVPRAQTKQQFQFLRRALSSLCNRPIVYLPFNRQLVFTAQTVTAIHKFLRSIAARGGIWLCEPEQLLSLRLLGLDKLLRSTVESKDNGGIELTELQKWLDNNTQDILDESDEVLQTRQQVIYTVGQQARLDAAPKRWEIIQKLLDLLSSYFQQQRLAEYELAGVYMDPSLERIASFPHIRIQSGQGRKHLEEFIRHTFDENQWSLPPPLKDSAIDFVTSKTPSDSSIQFIETYNEEDKQVKQTLLILRGMFHYDILCHALQDKRWRVDYGLDLKRTRLAVPYRAKDFPSARSEFGHPDVTILLTCLSYYYGGLNDEMVRSAVKALLKSASPDLTYSEWLKSCTTLVPRELQTIRGINMDDDNALTTTLFPLLRWNKVVINFYLNFFVFPKEAREFPFKLLSSGWDLAAKKRYPTTGFSGTNDSRFLLPTPITQVDRPLQLHTNAKVLSRLLLEENKTVIQHQDGFKSADLLDLICDLWDPPTVILDVGAQILDCTNEEFARSWLARYKGERDISAIVFFDAGGNMSVLTRDGTTMSFLDSPYSSTLERCLVYLDDVHTRGTDLRLPPCNAVVTLGPRLTKDKLVQGCMRMRRLGDGHKLIFTASDEVTTFITRSTGCRDNGITTADVLLWTIQETWRQAQSDLPAWVQQGKSFMQREKAWKGFSQGRITKERICSLFCEPEARNLESLYGLSHAHAERLLHGLNGTDDIGRCILQRCQEFDLTQFYDATILEEMEVELVHEKENEREVEEVPSAVPARHSIHEDVLKFVQTGIIPLKTSAFLKVRQALAHTSLHIPGGIDAAFSNTWVTSDFYNTIELGSATIPGTMDHFLRPVEWVMLSMIAGSPTIVALSPYEVNHLLPRIRVSTAVRLHVYALRGNLFMRTFENFDQFMLPQARLRTPLPSLVVLQINLFSGSLYIRDHAMYKNICAVLRLYFDEVPRHLQKPRVIELSGFVRSPAAREELGLVIPGFKSNPLPLFRKLLVMRRYGAKLGPSHMGKLLYSTKLHKGNNRDFEF